MTPKQYHSLQVSVYMVGTLVLGMHFPWGIPGWVWCFINVLGHVYYYLKADKQEEPTP